MFLYIKSIWNVTQVILAYQTITCLDSLSKRINIKHSEKEKNKKLQIKCLGPITTPPPPQKTKQKTNPVLFHRILLLAAVRYQPGARCCTQQNKTNGLWLLSTVPLSIITQCWVIPPHQHSQSPLWHQSYFEQLPLKETCATFSWPFSRTHLNNTDLFLSMCHAEKTCICYNCQWCYDWCLCMSNGT